MKLNTNLDDAIKKALKGFDNDHHHICPLCAENWSHAMVCHHGYIQRCADCVKRLAEMKE